MCLLVQFGFGALRKTITVAGRQQIKAVERQTSEYLKGWYTDRESVLNFTYIQ